MLKAPVQKDLFSDDQEMYSVSSEENVRETGNNVPEATTGTEEVIPPVTTERAAEALKIPLKGGVFQSQNVESRLIIDLLLSRD